MVASEVLISHVLLSYSQVVYTFWVQSYNNLLKLASVLQEKMPRIILPMRGICVSCYV